MSKSRFFVKKNGSWISITFLELRQNGEVLYHYSNSSRTLMKIDAKNFYRFESGLISEVESGILKEIMEEELALII